MASQGDEMAHNSQQQFNMKVLPSAVLILPVLAAFAGAQTSDIPEVPVACAGKLTAYTGCLYAGVGSGNCALDDA